MIDGKLFGAAVALPVDRLVTVYFATVIHDKCVPDQNVLSQNYPVNR